MTAVCAVFDGVKEFTKRETIGEKRRYKVSLLLAGGGEGNGQLAKKRRRRKGEKKRSPRNQEK